MTRFILAIILGFLSTASLADTVSKSPVAKIMLTPKPHIQAMWINGLSKITNIITTGKYAWAFDTNQNKVAFYNGEKWSEAQAISGILKITDFFPAYPQTATKPEAWVMGETPDGSQGVAFFNGTSWAAAQDVSKILKTDNLLSIEMRVSAGYVYLTAQKNRLASPEATATVYYSINNPKTHTWSATQQLEVDNNFGSLQSMNDLTPSLYFLTSKDGENPRLTLNRLSGEGTLTSTELAGAPSPSTLFGGDLIVNRNNIYVSYNSTDGKSILAFSNTGKIDALSYVSSTDKNPFFTPIYYGDNGLVFRDLQTVSSYSLSYINTDKLNPNWINVPITDAFSYAETIYRPDGAWVNYNRDNMTHILDYDFKNNQLHETHYPVAALSKLREIAPNKIVSCSRIARYPTLYYYDKENAALGWQLIDMSQSNLSLCGYSLGGNTTYDIVAGETVWLFNKEPEQSSFKKINKKFRK